MQLLILLSFAVSIPLILLGLFYTTLLSGSVFRVHGLGRILYFAHASLKLWAGAASLFFVVNTLFPNWSDDAGNVRLGIRLALGVYLLLQALAVDISLYRWRKNALRD